MIIGPVRGLSVTGRSKHPDTRDALGYLGQAPNLQLQLRPRCPSGVPEGSSRKSSLMLPKQPVGTRIRGRQSAWPAGMPHRCLHGQQVPEQRCTRAPGAAADYQILSSSLQCREPWFFASSGADAAGRMSVTGCPWPETRSSRDCPVELPGQPTRILAAARSGMPPGILRNQ